MKSFEQFGLSVQTKLRLWKTTVDQNWFGFVVRNGEGCDFDFAVGGAWPPWLTFTSSVAAPKVFHRLIRLYHPQNKNQTWAKGEFKDLLVLYQHTKSRNKVYKGTSNPPKEEPLKSPGPFQMLSSVVIWCFPPNWTTITVRLSSLPPARFEDGTKSSSFTENPRLEWGHSQLSRAALAAGEFWKSKASWLWWWNLQENVTKDHLEIKMITLQNQ